MKPIVFAVFLVMLSIARAQVPEHVRVVSEDEFSDTQSPEQNQRIAERVARGVEAMRRQGILPQGNTETLVPDLAWPLRPLAGLDQFDYHGTSNFVDHGPQFPGPDRKSVG